MIVNAPHRRLFAFSWTEECRGTYRRWLVYVCECGAEHRILSEFWGPLFD